MMDKHLNFEELSNLIDNQLTDEEREACLAHISQCSECAKEYESLLKALSLVSSLNKEELAFPDFSKSTITIYKRREKKRLLAKVIPTIAASIMIVMGIGFIKNGTFSNTALHLRQNSPEYGDAQKIIDHIGTFKIKVIKVDNSYIDTEFDRGMFADFEILMNKNNIKHSEITHSTIAINAFEKNTEAFVGSKSFAQRFNNSSLENGKIRIRIFK